MTKLPLPLYILCHLIQMFNYRPGYFKHHFYWHVKVWGYSCYVSKLDNLNNMIRINDKNKWRPVELKSAVFSDGADGLIGIEECTNYDLGDILRHQEVGQIFSLHIAVFD